MGFLPPTDPRVLGTIAAIQRELTEDGLVKRYDTGGSDDGLSGGEGLFLACSFWLVDALPLAGQDAEATALFERLLTCATTSVCSARSGTSPPNANSATLPRRSATSPWLPALCNCTPAGDTSAATPSTHPRCRRLTVACEHPSVSLASPNDRYGGCADPSYDPPGRREATSTEWRS